MNLLPNPIAMTITVRCTKVIRNVVYFEHVVQPDDPWTVDRTPKEFHILTPHSDQFVVDGCYFFSVQPLPR